MACEPSLLPLSATTISPSIPRRAIESRALVMQVANVSASLRHGSTTESSHVVNSVALAMAPDNRGCAGTGRGSERSATVIRRPLRLDTWREAELGEQLGVQEVVVADDAAAGDLDHLDGPAPTGPGHLVIVAETGGAVDRDRQQAPVLARCPRRETTRPGSPVPAATGRTAASTGSHPRRSRRAGDVVALEGVDGGGRAAPGTGGRPRRRAARPAGRRPWPGPLESAVDRGHGGVEQARPPRWPASAAPRTG